MHESFSVKTSLHLNVVYSGVVTFLHLNMFKV